MPTLWAFISSFTMTTHQIWLCHVTLTANFKIFYFYPNYILHYMLGKVTKFKLNWLKNNKVTDKKQNSGGGKHLLGLMKKIEKAERLDSLILAI